jgi:hypothetical protein
MTHWFASRVHPLRRPIRTRVDHGRFRPRVEPLAERVLPAVTALFSAGTLRVTGDDQDNIITVSRDTGGTIFVNNGAVPMQGGTATVANTTHFHIVGAGGSDRISLNETNGPLPGAAIFGGDGNDVLFGGSGDDFVDGGPGNDTVFLGAGDDTFQWNPGDGSDVVEGQGGNDTMVFNGSDLAEKFDISSDSNRVQFTRDVGNVTIDLNGVEEIDLNPFGGADTITVNDQSATDLFTVNLDLNGSTGIGDGQTDAVVINGTDGDDAIQIAAVNNNTAIVVGGLFSIVSITGAEGTNDHLMVNTLGGNDVVDASNLPTNLIGLTVDLGEGQVAAPRVTGVVVNGGAAQRSVVTQVQITFDQHVILPANPADAFRLVRQGDGAVVTLRAIVDDDTGDGTVVTLAFAGATVEGKSLADGRYTLTVAADQVSGKGGALDGDGQAGGDFVLAGDPAANGLFRLFGDVSGDGVVNGIDFGLFRTAFGTAAGDANFRDFLDVNGDGAINGLDFAAFRARFGTAV